MSPLDGIVDLAAARVMIGVQTAIAVKVLKAAHAQGDAALQLLQAARQDLQESLKTRAEAPGSGFDAWA